MTSTYALGRFVLAPLARAVYRPHVEGRENVPRQRSVVFASDHLSFIDSFAIPITAPRAVNFLAKASYFEGTGLRGGLSRRFLRAIGASPVQRGAGRAGVDALEVPAAAPLDRLRQALPHERR